VKRSKNEDLRLVRRLIRRDERAFEEFFDGYFQRLYRFAWTRLERDDEAAAEVVQETLCRAIDKLASYRGDAPLFTWMCSICRNRIADRFAEAQRLRPLDLAEDGPAARVVLESVLARPEGPEQAARRRELVRFVHATLDHLAPHYARALELRYLDGLSVPEVAERLGLGYKGTESVLSRARAAFRDGFAALQVALGPVAGGEAS
jgi:RNA polymerase sigma-70 factor (ECF subfamily)